MFTAHVIASLQFAILVLHSSTMNIKSKFFSQLLGLFDIILKKKKKLVDTVLQHVEFILINRLYYKLCTQDEYYKK